MSILMEIKERIQIIKLFGCNKIIFRLNIF